MLDSYHTHEVLDRTNMVIDIISTHLLDHPFIEAHEEIKNKIYEAIKNLGDAYQMIGREHL